MCTSAGAHASVGLLWYIMVILITSVHHSGYHFPFLPSSESHDFHHAKWVTIMWLAHDNINGIKYTRSWMYISLLLSCNTDSTSVMVYLVFWITYMAPTTSSGAVKPTTVILSSLDLPQPMYCTLMTLPKRRDRKRMNDVFAWSLSCMCSYTLFSIRVRMRMDASENGWGCARLSLRVSASMYTSGYSNPMLH